MTDGNLFMVPAQPPVQGETLLENRKAEIASIRAKAADAEKCAAALKAQLEEVKTQITAANDRPALGIKGDQSNSAEDSRYDQTTGDVESPGT